METIDRNINMGNAIKFRGSFWLKTEQKNPLKYYIIFLMLTFIFLLPVAAYSSEKTGWQWIEAERVLSMLKEGSGLWLIDVRGSIAYNAEHIEGSVNIASDFLTYKKLPKNKTLILVDDSIGQKTAMNAAEAIVKNGLEKVYVLKGGIISWELDGHPLVKNKSLIRGVTAEELKWAISKKIPLKTFDMRDPSLIKNGAIEGSRQIDGKDKQERLNKLIELLKKEEGSDLSVRLKEPSTIVLIFSASEDAEGAIEKIFRDVRGDIRYLIGGYETMVAKRDRKVKTTGECPTCPGKKK